MTLHTKSGCTMNVKRKETGKALTSNCYNGMDDNAGCGVRGSGDTYGNALNANNGGVSRRSEHMQGNRPKTDQRK